MRQESKGQDGLGQDGRGQDGLGQDGRGQDGLGQESRCREIRKIRTGSYTIRDDHRSESVGEALVVAAKMLGTMDQPEESPSNPPRRIRRENVEEEVLRRDPRHDNFPTSLSEAPENGLEASSAFSTISVGVLVPGTWYPHIRK